MKVQCSCGAKVAFDVVPEMGARPIQFVCPTCGRDSSVFINQLIRQELSGAPSPVPPGQAIPIPANIAMPAPQPIPIMPTAPAAAPPPPRVAAAEPAPAPVSIPSVSIPSAAAAPAPIRVAAPQPVGAPAALVPSVPAAPAPALSIAGRGHAAPVAAPPVTAATAAPIATGGEGTRCSKHANMQASGTCFVCGRPICTKCMELFGYLCSPLCKGKAEANHMKVPVYAGQKSVMEGKLWRKVGGVTFVVLGVLGLIFGVWFWYAWFGSRPSPAFSVHFEEVAYSGQTAMLGKDQLVMLHGGEFALHNIKTKAQIWSHNLVDMGKVREQAAKSIKAMEEENANSPLSARDLPRIPTIEREMKDIKRSTEEAMHLRVLGDNIWIITPTKLTRYDRTTGNPDKEIELPREAYGGLLPRGDELIQMGMDDAGNENITHINLNNCEVRTEDIRKVSPFSTNDANRLIAGSLKSGAKKAGGKGSDLAGLPMKPGSKDANKPMDPKKVSEDASHLSLPERIALPATLSNTRNQDRALSEMNDGDTANGKGRKREPEERFQVMLTKDGYMQVSIRMLEEHLTEHVAMKAAPKKSALDGNLTAGKSMEVASEILNEMQRDRGGATTFEDESRYQVIFKKPDDPSPCKGEVIGMPRLFPLTTVDVLASNKKITVFDKTHKKLWDASLTYNVGNGPGEMDDEESNDTHRGQGPCVEHKDVLYVYDQGVLTAFDLASGAARWRVPSVGIAGLFFDDQENIYVNTSTASPDTLKYANQIDLTRKNSPIVMKVDAKSGKALWAAQPGGPVAYVSGKYVYTLLAYNPYEDDEHPIELKTGFETLPYISVKRLNPKNGHQMW